MMNSVHHVANGRRLIINTGDEEVAAGEARVCGKL